MKTLKEKIQLRVTALMPFLLSAGIALGQQINLPQNNLVDVGTLTNTDDVFSTDMGAASAELVRLTVAPNVPSQIALKALPKATCILHPDGYRDAEHSLKLFADDDGMVRFEVRPSGESDELGHFQVDCRADGKLGRFPLDLRASSSPTWDMPAPTPEAPQRKAGAQVRPALTVDDAKRLSVEELLAGGYPVRPDLEQAPAAFTTWLKAVTKPSTFVPPRLVPNPGVRHRGRQVSAGPETSNNWSGFELRGAINSYDLVEGGWVVPFVTGEVEGTCNPFYPSCVHVPTFSSLWIGLDGDWHDDPQCPAASSCDLVQEGTEQEALWWGSFAITGYYAWTEFLPQEQTEQVLGGLTVYSGDEIYSELYMCNPVIVGYVSLCLPSPSGAYAYFFMEDFTQSWSTAFTVSSGNTVVGGYEAEWIMERPKVGQPPHDGDLADYGVAFMSDAYAQKPNGQWVVYNGANNEQITMTNGNDVLSIVLPFPLYPPSSTMEFLWTNFH